MRKTILIPILSLKLRRNFNTFIGAIFISFPIISSANDKCGTTDPISETECIQQSTQTAENALNAFYLRLQKSLQNVKDAENRPVPLKAKLISAQQAWEKYRDKTCELEGNVALSGNPNRGALFFEAKMNCRTRLANLRIKELQAFGDEYSLW